MTKLVAVGMVRNEADIVEAFVRHTLRYVDALDLTDHLSTDATPQILNKLQQEGLPLRVSRHRGQARVQEHLTTEMAHRAIAEGADWVIPLDCDEFVDAPDRSQFDHALKRGESCGIVGWPWISMVPHETDDRAEIDPVRRIRHRRVSENIIVPKCLVHRNIMSFQGWQFAPGNHFALKSDQKRLPLVQLPRGFALRHYPIRSTGQFVSKITLGHLAWLSRPNNDPKISFHTKAIYDRMKTGWLPGDADLTLLASNYQDPDCKDLPDLVDDPLPAGHVLRYTQEMSPQPLPLLLDWAEQMLTRDAVDPVERSDPDRRET